MRKKRPRTHRIALDLPAAGMKGVFYWGVYAGLPSNFVVDRVYGRSSGAMLGACILCGVEGAMIWALYARVQHLNKTHPIVDSWCTALTEILPHNAHVLCSKRLFVTVMVLGMFPVTTSYFRDKHHLIETLRASGSVPMITTRKVCFTSWNLPVLDGGLRDLVAPPKCLGKAKHACAGGPGRCGAGKGMLHLLRVQAPQTLALSAQFTRSVVKHTLAMGVAEAATGKLNWSHVRQTRYE